MPHDSLAADLRLRGIDLARGTGIRGLRGRFAQSQWRSAEALGSEQFDRLGKLLTFAVASVPRFRELADLPLPRDASGLADWPVGLKADMRRRPDAYCSDPAHGGRSLRRKTGGSTGEPFIYAMGLDAFSWQWAGILRAWEWSGYRFGERMATLGGGSVAPSVGMPLAQRVYHWLRRNDPVPAAELDPASLDRFAAALRSRQPVLLYGYPSILHRLARHLQDRGETVGPLRSVITTSEMLFPRQRATIAEVFRAPVFDMYGCNEPNLVTAECDRHDGYHVAMEACLVEVVDAAGRPLPDGEVGRILATGLHNRSMIFLRYDTGDLGALDRTPCACGRGLVRIRNLQGRSRDFLRARDGRLIHGVAMNETVLKHGWVERYQAIQEDAARLRIVLSVLDDASPDLLDALRADVAALTGLEIALEPGGVFERTSGAKARVIISRLENDERS